MSKTNSYLLAFILAMCSGIVFADTIEDLSIKSRRALELDADITIAKKEFELKQAGISASTNSALILKETAVTGAPKPVQDFDNFEVVAIHGDVGNPSIDIMYRGSRLERKKGDAAVGDWVVYSINRSEVKFIRRNAKGKVDFTTRYPGQSGSKGVYTISSDEPGAVAPVPVRPMSPARAK